MAREYERFTALGGLLAGVSVDPPGRNATMVAKLHLPFPLLSDPGGERALRGLGLFSERERGGIAVPAVRVVAPDGRVVYAYTGRDYADRPVNDDVVAALGGLGLAAAEPEPVAPGEPEQGRLRIYPLPTLQVYFRAVRYAAQALGRRMRDPDDQAACARMLAMIERFEAGPPQGLDGREP